MTSFITPDQDIAVKKSVSLNLWLALFIFLQILTPLCNYFLKQLGAAGNFVPLYAKIAADSFLLSVSLLLLLRKGVSVGERLEVYKKNAPRDILASLAIAGLGLLLGYTLIHFNAHGQVFSVNAINLSNLISESGGGLSYVGVALIIIGYCLLVPAMEEVFFRRLLYVSLRHKYSLFRSILINSLLFGAIHPDSVLFTIIFSVMQCYVYERFGRVSVNILSHLIFNSTVIGLAFLGV